MPVSPAFRPEHASGTSVRKGSPAARLEKFRTAISFEFSSTAREWTEALTLSAMELADSIRKKAPPFSQNARCEKISRPIPRCQTTRNFGQPYNQLEAEPGPVAFMTQ